MVSIIYPLLNINSKFSASLNSLVNQTYSDIEIIIVANSQLEKCQDKIDKLIKKGAPITIYKIDDQKSHFYAYFWGAKKAKGDYLAFIDSTDYLYQNYLEALMKVLEKDQLIKIATASFLRYKDNKTYSGLTFKEEVLVGNAKFDSRELSNCRLWNTVVEKRFFLEFINNEELSSYYDSTLVIAILLSSPKYYRHQETLYFRGSLGGHSLNFEKADILINKLKEFQLPKKILENLIIDEILVRQARAIMVSDQNLDELDKIINLCKENIRNIKRKIIFMNRPIIFKRAIFAILNRKHKKAEKLFNRLF